MCGRGGYVVGVGMYIGTVYGVGHALVHEVCLFVNFVHTYS